MLANPPIAYWRLDFIDQDFKLIFPCQIPLVRHAIIRAYHIELLKKCEGLTVWPPPPDEPEEEESWDLYGEFALYYRKIVGFIDPLIDCDRLLPSSRHLFFICTEPLVTENAVIPGLSGLEQLMGFNLPEPGKEQPKPKDDSPTTGDTVLDVKVDIYLIFKGRAARLIEEHSLDELCRMAKQAGDRMQQAKEGEESEEKQVKEAEDDEWFTSKKAMFLNRLKSQKIAVPGNF